MTHRRPLRLGLTGSIAMGKSETARMFVRQGVPVFDADAEVHATLAAGRPGHAAVAAAFPEAVRDGEIDRQALGKRVFGDADALRRLEALLHPLVGRARTRFLRRADFVIPTGLGRRETLRAVRHILRMVAPA